MRPDTVHSPAVEDYLKAIFELRGGGRVSNGALAERLGFTAGAVTGMVKKLAEDGLVVHEPYRGVDLTDAGRRIAADVLRRRRLIEQYLHRDLGVPWEAVHAEADRWEHVLSDDVLSRMGRRLDHRPADQPGAPAPERA